PDPQQAQPSGLKHLLFRSAAFGAAFAVTLCLIVGGFLWYTGRPEPPKTWNATAIVVKDPPSFNVGDDGKRVTFKYFVENTTDTDYNIDSEKQIKVTLKLTNGALTPPLPSLSTSTLLHLAVFIPAKQKALIIVELPGRDIPQRVASESDAEYHERIRTYCNEHFKNVADIVLFDDVNRYQISLP